MWNLRELRIVAQLLIWAVSLLVSCDRWALHLHTNRFHNTCAVTMLRHDCVPVNMVVTMSHKFVSLPMCHSPDYSRHDHMIVAWAISSLYIAAWLWNNQYWASQYCCLKTHDITLATSEEPERWQQQLSTVKSQPFDPHRPKTGHSMWRSWNITVFHTKTLENVFLNTLLIL